MSRILVTGASGLLGLNFGLQFCDRHEIIGISHQHALQGMPFAVRAVDLSEHGAARRLVEEIHPDVVLHCAALANVDQAERQPVLAQRINAEVPGELAEVCARLGLRMLHISTDSVFDGLRGNYTESDLVQPLNRYARTKWLGEQAVLSANPQAIVARVNFYGWSLTGRRSLAEIFYHTLAAGQSMFGFRDVFFCPLHVSDLGRLLLEMVEHNLQGVYHVVSSEALSKYDFGCRIARHFGLDEGLIRPVSWQEAGLTAPRAPQLTLNTEKLASALGRRLPGQADGLEHLHAQFQMGFPARIRQLAG